MRREVVESYNINDFDRAKPVGKIKKCSHKIDIRTQQDSDFYCKEMEGPRVARLELLAQELFRVFIPSQPKTKLAFNEQTRVAYILSEVVDRYQDLPKNSFLFKRDGYTGRGLGQVSVLCAYLQEVDYKNGNVGLDGCGNVVKIDGDWSFAGIREPIDFPIDTCPITKELLENLPYPVGFKAYNWLDLRCENINYPHSRIVGQDLGQNAIFKQEVYQAMLKIVMTPDIFLENIVDACFPADGERYIEFLKTRRDTFRSEAEKMPGFIDYLKSPLAYSTEQEHLQQLRTFTINKDHLVIGDKDQEPLNEGFRLMSTVLDRSHLFFNKVEQIKSALNTYSPTLSIGLFSLHITLGHEKNSAKHRALTLLNSRHGLSNEDLYKKLYDILYRPFCNEDVTKDTNGRHTRFLAVLQTFDMPLAELGYDSYTQTRSSIKESQIAARASTYGR